MSIGKCLCSTSCYLPGPQGVKALEKEKKKRVRQGNFFLLSDFITTWFFSGKNKYEQSLSDGSKVILQPDSYTGPMISWCVSPKLYPLYFFSTFVSVAAPSPPDALCPSALAEGLLRASGVWEAEASTQFSTSLPRVCHAGPCLCWAACYILGAPSFPCGGSRL